MVLEKPARRSWLRADCYLALGPLKMCLSSRTSESCRILLPTHEASSTVDCLARLCRNLPDSMTTTWDASLISNLLIEAFAPSLSKIPSDRAPVANIDVLITFDGNGVSGHPNHISLFHGARTFLAAIMKRHAGWKCPIALYTLSSTSTARKYLFVVDALFTLLDILMRKKKQRDPPSPLLFVSGPGAYRAAQHAMTKAHQSQMRWFRWGWIACSRYMVMNDYNLEKVS